MIRKLVLLTFMTCSMAGHAQELSIAMTGDVMMGTTFPSIMLPANDGRYLFKDAKDILTRTDLTVGNLEGAICDGGESTKGNGPNSYSFRTPTSYGHLLKEAGFDFMSMANNHANDFGIEGIESTESVLDAQGILYSGIEGRIESAVIERKGLKIGLCAFGHNSYTLKHLDLETVGRIVDDHSMAEPRGALRGICLMAPRHSLTRIVVRYANWLTSASIMEPMWFMDMAHMWFAA